MSSWFLDPYSKINEVFNECQKIKKCWVTEIENFFAEEAPKSFDKVPWLNDVPLHHLQPKQVVRFRGMIQDMYDPELYMETCTIRKGDGTETHHPGRYLDVFSCSPTDEILFNSHHSETQQRMSYLCISIPGENDWVKKVYSQQNSNSKTFEAASSSYSKRSITEVEEMCEDLDGSIPEKQQNVESKKLKENAAALKPSDMASKIDSLTFPLPEADDRACLLKVYNNKVDLLLNDVIEALGILTMDPPLSPEEEEANSLLRCQEFQDRDLPPSLVPRLHVLYILKKSHCNPLLPSVIEHERIPSSSLNIRELLGSVLETALLGDGLASEYLLCHLISSIYSRQDILPIGKFCVNLFGISPELQEKGYSKCLYNILSTLITHSSLFEMTIENLTKLDFTPTKNYEENYLRSGLLQLPPNFHLVVDETKLSAGNLDAKAVRNLTALGNLVRWQKVDYGFQFHTIEQHTNVPVLILSEGKAMISSDYHVYFRPKHTDVQLAMTQVRELLTPHVLKQLRTYLTYSRLMPHTLSQSMQKNIQDDFVASRERSEGMTADDLHSLLTLARLLAQGCGQTELKPELWKSARMMEEERKQQLKD